MKKEITNFFAERGYMELTERTYRDILMRLLTQTDPETLTAAGLVEFLRNQDWGNSRQRLGLFASHAYLRWRYGEKHPALRAKIKRIKSKSPPSLTPVQGIRILSSFDNSTALGARNLAMAALWLDTGLRCSEMIAVQRSDVDLDFQVNFMGKDFRCGFLQVPVKGGDPDYAIFSEQTAMYIREYLAFPFPRKSGVDNLFVSFRRNHSYAGRPITPSGAWKLVSEWGKKVDWGEKEIRLSPHVFRRGFADLASLFGAPSRIVQKGGRWKDLKRVEDYTRHIQLLAMIPYLPVANMVR